MEIAPFFVDFHHFLSIFTIFYRRSRFSHFCRDLHFVAIYALFPQFFFGQNSHHRNITRFLHVCLGEVPDSHEASLSITYSICVTNTIMSNCSQKRSHIQNKSNQDISYIYRYYNKPHWSTCIGERCVL